MSPLPTRTPVELEDRPRHHQWLINALWGREAVGIIGGEPKCGKSFLALDLAVSEAWGVFDTTGHIGAFGARREP